MSQNKHKGSQTYLLSVLIVAGLFIGFITSGYLTTDKDVSLKGYNDLALAKTLDNNTKKVP